MELQPSETAPKTGEHIIVVSLGKKGFGRCGGKDQDWADVVHYWDNPGEEGFYMSNGPEDRPVLFTHWMSIPQETPLEENT